MNNYGQIPEYLLNVRLGETYDGDYYLKDELDNLNEDVIWYDFEAETIPETGELRLNWFTCYTENKVATLILGALGDQQLVRLDRNPPPQNSETD